MERINCRKKGDKTFLGVLVQNKSNVYYMKLWITKKRNSLKTKKNVR